MEGRMKILLAAGVIVVAAGDGTAVGACRWLAPGLSVEARAGRFREQALRDRRSVMTSAP
jgi:hypothetical protein